MVSQLQLVNLDKHGATMDNIDNKIYNYDGSISWDEFTKDMTPFVIGFVSVLYFMGHYCRFEVGSEDYINFKKGEGYGLDELKKELNINLSEDELNKLNDNQEYDSDDGW